MASRAPERITWAVAQLKVKPTDRILEIGCGRGVAAALICEQLRTGRFIGLDRSAVAIAAAVARNREHVRSGKADFLKVALADAELRMRFDKVIAINVNVFWINPMRELAVIRQLLVPGGGLYLFYEPPSSSQLERAAAACVTYLRKGGFKIKRVLRDRSTRPLLGLVATTQA
ncbi:MAG TPA: class I SAM-dependent methyltransferase [Gemmatimonadaceae bacterium]|nr:class I SAM-dependent methyltransferase [Gemmatimonadaceae bacterium]